MNITLLNRFLMTFIFTAVTTAAEPKEDTVKDPPEPPAPACFCPADAPLARNGDVTTKSGEEMSGCTREVFKIHSPSMTRDIDVAVLLPPAYAKDPERKFPILYALHGRGAPFLSWTDMGPLRKALADKPMILVVFNGDKAGCYLDATLRPRSLFKTFFFDELVPYVDKTYRVHVAQRGITGFSMGGSGAVNYMIERPDFFVGVSALSTGIDLTTWTGRAAGTLEGLLGPKAGNEEAYRKAAFFSRCEEALKAGVRLPPLFLACGTEDKALVKAQNARDFFAKHGVPLEYQEAAGEHNWKYWRDTSAAVVDFHWRTFQPKEAVGK